MAMLENPLAGKSERALKRTIRQARKTWAQAEAQPASVVVQQGRQDEVLAAMAEAADTIERAEGELRRRRFEAHVEAAPLRRRIRDEAEAREGRRRKSQAARDALSALRYSPPPEVEGVPLDPTRLSEAEGAELLALVQARQKGTLTGADLERVGELLGIAAGNTGLFQEKARERELREKEEALAEAERTASLPEQTATGKGLAVLPSYLVPWLQNPEEGGLTVADVGVLATLLLSFSNRTPLVVGGRFEEEDGEAILVVPEDFRLLPAANPQSAHELGTSGRVREANSLAFLRLNDFFAVEKEGGSLRIRLGARAKALGT